MKLVTDSDFKPVTFGRWSEPSFEEPSTAPGLATFAPAPLGAVGGASHGAVVRGHSAK